MHESSMIHDSTVFLPLSPLFLLYFQKKNICAGIFKLLRSPGIDSKEIDSASLCSLAGQYVNPIPTRFLAPINCLKIPALSGRYDNPIPTGFLAHQDCSKIPALIKE